MKPIRRNTIPHDSRTRDAALRRLRRTNRWLIAGSAVLTGLFVDLAASAFSGHASNASARSQTHSKSAHTSTQPLKAPEQAPKPAETQSTEAPAPSEQERAPESSAPESSAPESSAPESSAPAQEPAPAETHESAPEPAPEEPSEPVVSGGS